MRLRLQIGWSCQFILNEKQLAQLMPLLEQLHFVDDHYVEGEGRIFTYKEFEPTVEVVLGGRCILTEAEFETLKQGKNNGS